MSADKEGKYCRYNEEITSYKKGNAADKKTEEENAADMKENVTDKGDVTTEKENAADMKENVTDKGDFTTEKYNSAHKEGEYCKPE